MREYQEDREVDAWFLIDLSASVDFGSNDVRKRAVGAEFVTVLSRLLTRHGNRVGALLYGDRVDTVLPARSGRRQTLHLAHALLTRPPLKRDSAGTKLAELVESAVRVVRRRSLVFVVSDFVSEPGWAKPLGLLARRHEVIAVRLSDPLERAMPNLGMVVVEDAETGEQMVVDMHDRGFRKRYDEAATRREAEMRDALRRRGRRRARARDRREPRRGDPALRRPAQAPHAARLGRRAAAHLEARRVVPVARGPLGPRAAAAFVLGYVALARRRKRRALPLCEPRR